MKYDFFTRALCCSREVSSLLRLQTSQKMNIPALHPCHFGAVTPRVASGSPQGDRDMGTQPGDSRRDPHLGQEAVCSGGSEERFPSPDKPCSCARMSRWEGADTRLCPQLSPWRLRRVYVEPEGHGVVSTFLPLSVLAGFSPGHRATPRTGCWHNQPAPRHPLRGL